MWFGVILGLQLVWRTARFGFSARSTHFEFPQDATSKPTEVPVHRLSKVADLHHAVAELHWQSLGAKTVSVTELPKSTLL